MPAMLQTAYSWKDAGSHPRRADFYYSRKENLITELGNQDSSLSRSFSEEIGLVPLNERRCNEDKVFVFST